MGDPVSYGRYAKCVQHGHRLRLRQNISLLRQNAFDDHARPIAVRWLLAARQPGRRLQQQTLIAVVSRKVGKRIDSVFQHAETGNMSIIKELPRFLYLAPAHPAGHDRFLVLLGRLDDRLGHFSRPRHGLRCQDHDGAVYAGIRKANVQRLLIALRRRITDDVDRVVV